MLGVSSYITNEVISGQEQIESAQKKVDQGNSLFGLSPYTKPIGQSMTGSAQKKINAGKEEVAYYANLASNLKTGGIVTSIVGAAMVLIGLLVPRKRK